jgi:hypothetical protein
VWLLNHPFYLLLLMAALGTAAMYYLLNFVADWQVPQGYLAHKKQSPPEDHHRTSLIRNTPLL